MTTINLKDFYYWYTQDQFIEVTEEVAEALRASVRYEAAYQRRLSRHKAQYSLDCEDGIEYSACLHEPTPQEVLELKERFIRLWNALNSLPEIQGRRIDAHIILPVPQHTSAGPASPTAGPRGPFMMATALRTTPAVYVDSRDRR